MVSSTAVSPASVSTCDISGILAIFCCNTAGVSGSSSDGGVVIVDLDGADAGGGGGAVIMLCCIQ
eukprot:1948866-Ditylum_brightwellii.AAC.1